MLQRIGVAPLTTTTLRPTMKPASTPATDCWGKRKAKNITKRDVVLLLEDIVSRGAPIVANRTFACIRRMFNFAVERDLLTSTPCAAVKAPAKENQRDRCLTMDEIRAFWTGLECAPMAEATRIALKLQLVTAQRKGEILGAEWSEISLASTSPPTT